MGIKRGDDDLSWLRVNKLFKYASSHKGKTEENDVRRDMGSKD
jgi:hypothetical protein